MSLQIKAPKVLYLEIALKYKIKQSKNGTVTHIFFLFAKELLLAPIDCSLKVSQYIAVCVVHPSPLAWISRSI